MTLRYNMTLTMILKELDERIYALEFVYEVYYV